MPLTFVAKGRNLEDVRARGEERRGSKCEEKISHAFSALTKKAWGF